MVLGVSLHENMRPLLIINMEGNSWSDAEMCLQLLCVGEGMLLTWVSNE
jgi:hypothetical protein